MVFCLTKVGALMWIDMHARTASRRLNLAAMPRILSVVILMQH
jgi:hypothetical protein